MGRRFLICLAFATWCFLDTWVEYAEGGLGYFARQDPIQAVVTPVICLTAILTLGMFGLGEFCRRRQLECSVSLHLLFLALCLGPLGIASVAVLRALPVNLTVVVRNPLFWPVALMSAVVPVVLVFRRPRLASQLTRSMFLYSWPVLILVLVQAARVTLLRYPGSSYADQALAAPLPASPGRVRVVWIIFDELSQTIVFGNRPKGLALPNFDRLRAVSFYASSANSPADSTKVSVPSLILGQPLLDATPQGPAGLLVRTSSGVEAMAWSPMPNIFDAARDRGFNTALVGWYLPYGRLLNRSLSKCYWTAAWLNAGIEEQSNPQPLAQGMWYRLRLQLTALPLVGRLRGMFPVTFHRQQKIERYLWLRDRAREISTDPAIGLALIHLPLPHPPAIYSRTRGRLTAQGKIGYLDSVVLADETLGELRQSMEEAGLWKNTAVLVSSDHGWRTQLWRSGAEWTAEEEAASHQDTSEVPFLLKLPGETAGVTYGKPFNTVVTRKLITSILEGRLTDAAAVSGLLRRP